MVFPLSALIYTFNATIALWYGLRNLRAYKITKNEYSLMFFRVGIGVGIAEYIYGIPALVMPGNSNLNGFLYMLAFFPLFLGLNEALRFALRGWGYDLWEGAMSVSMPLFVAIFFWFHLSAIPRTAVDAFGLIHWGVLYPYDVLFTVFLAAVTIIPGIFFLTAKVHDRKAVFKKILFGIAFVFGGTGGFGVVLLDETFLPLLFSFIMQFLGFAVLGSIFLVDIFMKDDVESAARNSYGV